MNPFLDHWKAKLSDFGSVGNSRSAPGNLFYAAPEALMPRRIHSPAMDVYSFGVVLTEMALRRSPSLTRKHVSLACAIDCMGRDEDYRVEVH